LPAGLHISRRPLLHPLLWQHVRPLFPLMMPSRSFRLAAVLLLSLTTACREERIAEPRPLSRRAAYEQAKRAKNRTGCPERPNILIVTLDTLRFDATSLDPRSTNDTPVLRKLAAEGVNFVNCYSTHDATPQSHFSLFTGYINGAHGGLDTPEASIAHQLKSLGYRSFGVAANMNVSRTASPWTLPFAEYENLGDEWASFSEQRKASLAPPLDARIRTYGGVPNDFYRLMLYGSAEAILPRFERQLASSQTPFLAFINLLESHDPYVPDPQHYAIAPEREVRAIPPPPLRYRPLSNELLHPDDIENDARRAFVEKKLEQAQGRAWSVAVDVDAAARKIYRTRYDAEVRELDRHVGSIVAMLDARRLRESTIVIITSDHGESFGEDELLTHSFGDTGDYESTHHVPMLILMPPCYGVRGVTVNATCSIADVPVTLYDLLGVNAAPLWKLAVEGNHGRSLLPLLIGAGLRHDAVAKVDGQKPRAMPAQQQQQMNEEAQKRLKALGYIQ
jgi:arylsulfatase A-like enzyme